MAEQESLYSAHQQIQFSIQSITSIVSEIRLKKTLIRLGPTGFNRKTLDPKNNRPTYFNPIECHVQPKLRAGEFRDRLGSLGHGVLGQLTRQHQSHSRLDLPRCNGRLLVIPCQSGRLLSKLLKDIIDETVHDTHGLAGNTDIGVDLLQHFEDVYLIGLGALLGLLLLLVTALL
ncbi:hypothetical protein G2W53_023979 [Senna tora]|uniref:Uncharacterized protein n=1 Tax=Senna tora TaxID=362788 RepID=A0A834WIP9_9FABA|nr:hypothetical protein G2W53_023979 [Senna tora]